MLTRLLATLVALAVGGAAFSEPIPPQHEKSAGHSAPAVKPKKVVIKRTEPKPAQKIASPLVRKPIVKKGPVRVALPKKAVAKKAVAKKAAVKQAGAKRPLPAKKLVVVKKKPPVVRKLVPAKKAIAKKPVAKKLVAKKALPKRTALLPVSVEKKTIQAKYDAMSLLVMRRDGPKLAKMMLGMTTPDFIYRDKTGRKQTRAKLITDLKAQLKMVKSFKRSGNKVTTFSMQGPTGKARVVSDFAMIFPNGRKNVSVEGQSTTIDTWVKVASGWKLRSIQTLKESVKYDGKKM